MNNLTIYESDKPIKAKYTVLVEHRWDGWLALVLSDRPGPPDGISWWLEGVAQGPHLGTPVEFDLLPPGLKLHIQDKLTFSRENQERIRA